MNVLWAIKSNLDVIDGDIGKDIRLVPTEQIAVCHYFGSVFNAKGQKCLGQSDNTVEIQQRLSSIPGHVQALNLLVCLDELYNVGFRFLIHGNHRALTFVTVDAPKVAAAGRKDSQGHIRRIVLVFKHIRKIYIQIIFLMLDDNP